MTSWVLSIDAEHPHHWDVAKRDLIWDLRTRRNIERGDTVYFWVAQRGLAGRGVVTADVVDSPPMGLPWDDAHETRYRGRIGFSRLEDYDGPKLTWTELSAGTGLGGAAHLAPKSSDSVVEANLAALFASGAPDQVAMSQTDEETLSVLNHPDADSLSEDRRELAFAQIRLRQGQPAFRNKLLKAYRRSCAVTGTTTDAVLEAAHILPYRGVHTNTLSNGILLRADVHTLFDRLLLTIVPRQNGTLVTRTSPSLGGHYAALDDQALAVVPSLSADLPSHEFLGAHAAQCGWLED
ncbi:HNH endonuclease [Sanguibacter gelidistatuariae]|uniref:HNH endonuclease n=1 Tax=Sanguibacter gelidistatuariae TaxID=1814289 RepID=A0A1G6Y166_9MICO|nr:HNH endonuclease [Sanguibacter gelidistatuariae]SDD84060.1 HNH endonuclease [Sanguibacter gelidistatuariae]